MIESSAFGLLLFILFAVVASAAGCVLASAWAWTDEARASRLPLAWGVGAGPLLLGLAAVVVLAVLPGASHTVHLLAVFLTMAAVVALGGRHAWRTCMAPAVAQPWSPVERVLGALLLLWIAGLLCNALFIPLTQNDSLEYATVGRILYEARSLWAYPAIHPQETASGFYGPWTHPPLYVAQIYLTAAMQGHADGPGLMRLVSPWCLVACVAVFVAWARSAGRVAALLGALVFLSAPLLFLGAESALIDALPVLGLLLTLAAISGVARGGVPVGIAAGVGLGFALWTHSQAILFIPLCAVALLAREGWRGLRTAVVAAIAMLVVAAAISGLPYLRNLHLFGSLVSDNPAVFALPQLGWPDYFRIGRGVDSWPAIIQYGWFKGWFAPEAYGFAFWLMLLGVAVLAAEWRRRRDLPAAVRIALVVVGCYLAGVVASTLIGLDLMIKNERYMLVVLPLVGLLAGIGLQRLLAGRRVVALPVAAALVAVFALQLVVLVGYRLAANGLTLARIGQPFVATLQGRPEYLVVDYLRRETPRDAVVLSLKPADMYYAGRRMVSYLDPRMLPFYAQKDPAAALAELRKLGVGWIHVPDYGLPSLQNSAVPQILRNPAWARLVYQADGNQVYSLAMSGLADGGVTDLAVVPWNRSTTLVLGGRKALANVAGAPQRIDPRQGSQGGGPAGLFHREWSTLLVAGEQSPIPVRAGGEYALDLQLAGHGLVRVWLQQFDGDRPLKDTHLRSQSRLPLTDLILGGTYAERALPRRIRMLPGANRVVLTLEHMGTSTLRVQDARLTALQPAS